MSSSGVPAGHDLIRLDHTGARALVGALADGADALRRDRSALAGMLDQASDLLRRDQARPLAAVGSATDTMAVLGYDLARRLVDWEQRVTDQARIDTLTAELRAFRGPPNDAARTALEQERYELVRGLVAGDERFAIRVVGALAGAASFRDAVATVVERMNHEYRVESAMDDYGLDLAAAEALVGRIDSAIVSLMVQGHSRGDAAAVVILAVEFGLDVHALAARALARDMSLIDAARDGLFAHGFGLSLDEYDAMNGLVEHFAVFDTATFTKADGRVSIADLEFVVAEPCYFTDGQVLAARLLLDNPALLNRLDTANENDDIFGDHRDSAPGGFGRITPGDGLIAEVDLQAFALKAQLNAILGPYSDRIDIGDDPKAIVDGYRSEADFRGFLADSPDLPEQVVAAAEVMIEAGWFDESWWQENKDALALAAALLASGIVVIGTGGTASLLVLGAVGAGAAGATTIAVNLGTDDDLLDDVGWNSVRGLVVGVSVGGVYSGVGGAASGGSRLARVHGVAEATAGATDLILSGSLDLVTPDAWEGPIDDMVTPVNAVASAVDIAAGGIIDRLPMATYETLEEQLEALSVRISRQKQERHLTETVAHGGHMDSVDDAQRVLDAVHDGTAEILGRKPSGHIVVRVDDVVGTHVNDDLRLVVETDVFMVKGTASPSIVPINPEVEW